MKAQCLCVIGPRRIAEPYCEKCAGTGFYEVSFPDEGDIIMIWLGRCPVCGASNGCRIQRVGDPQPQNADPHWRCVNHGCERPPVELVPLDSVTSWSAVCFACGVAHFADFQQRAHDHAPTIISNPRTCPRCTYGDMTWMRDSDLSD